MRYGLMSRYTSYVAIETRSDDEKTTEHAELRRIPIALTTGWGGVQVAPSAGGAVAFGAPPAAAPMRFTTGAMPPIQRKAMAVPPAAPRRSSSIADSIVDTIGDVFGRITQKAKETSKAPDLYDVLLTQKADGSFPLSRALVTLAGTTEAALKGAVGQHGEAIVATAIALAVLLRDFADQRDEWSAGAAKAQAWLDRQGNAFDAAAYVH